MIGVLKKSVLLNDRLPLPDQDSCAPTGEAAEGLVTGTGWEAAGATEMGVPDIPLPMLSGTISGVRSEDPVGDKRSSSDSISGLWRSEGSLRAETGRLRRGRDGRRPEPMNRSTDILASLFSRVFADFTT